MFSSLCSKCSVYVVVGDTTLSLMILNRSHSNFHELKKKKKDKLKLIKTQLYWMHTMTLKMPVIYNIILQSANYYTKT